MKARTGAGCTGNGLRRDATATKREALRLGVYPSGSSSNRLRRSRAPCMMRSMRRVSVVVAAGIPLGVGECGKRFQPARGHFVPWDERVGIEFELLQGIPTGMGSKDFLRSLISLRMSRSPSLSAVASSMRKGNPHFPALRSGPTAAPGASLQKQIPSSKIKGSIRRSR